MESNTEWSWGSWVAVVFGISAFLFVAASCLLVMGAVGNFLTAPIGLKPAPPDPPEVLQLATAALWPLLGSSVVLWLLKGVAEELEQLWRTGQKPDSQGEQSRARPSTPERP